MPFLFQLNIMAKSVRIYGHISTKSSSRNQGQHECCHGSQRYNLLRDLIQLYSLPINFLRNLAPPQWGAGLFSLHPAWSVSLSSFAPTQTLRCPRFLRRRKQETLRLLRDSPPASALYVHDRVSGCVRDWSNHPGLEICCGCIPPSDNVAMDQPSPLPSPTQDRPDRIGNQTGETNWER